MFPAIFPILVIKAPCVCVSVFGLGLMYKYAVSRISEEFCYGSDTRPRTQFLENAPKSIWSGKRSNL
jgi:hypothetical protein